ncbi:tRNA lysidine(34) synthetase TilS [Elusimicrobiota bacterium]
MISIKHEKNIGFYLQYLSFVYCEARVAGIGIREIHEYDRKTLPILQCVSQRIARQALMRAPKSKFRVFWGITWKKFLGAIRKYRMIKKGDRILALVSGGPDSTALALWLGLLRNKLDFDFCILYLDHGLCAQSFKAGGIAQKTAKMLGIRFYSRKIRVASFAKKFRKSLEDAGRILRYREALRMAKKLKCNKVAVGHTMDEQAESVLINILRGCEVKRSMGAYPDRPISFGSSIRLIRPLIGIKKSEVIEYLGLSGIKYFKDPMNRDKAFLRVRIRKELMPKFLSINPRAVEHLANLKVSGIAKLR